MNKLNFNQVGGFPMTANVLKEMQKSWDIFNALGLIAGNLSIISGCTITGTNVSDGVVCIDGEVLEFRGGDIQTKVIIKQDVTQMIFQDNNNKDVLYTRYATFGTAISDFKLWADFKRIFPAKDVQEALDTKANANVIQGMMDRINSLESKTSIFQAGGGMVLWNKPVGLIPSGWAEVVNWRGRIPIGQDTTDPNFNEIGKEGGAQEAALTAENNGPHSHDTKINTNAAGSGYFAFEGEAGSSEILHTFASSESGAGEPFSIMNPYRVAIFIEYIG